MNNSSESVNITQASPLACPSDEEPVAISWIKAVVYLMLLCIALFGNPLVIWTVYKHKRMHTAPNFLIVNIAVGDLFMAVANMIPTAVDIIRGMKSPWVSDGTFGQFCCKLVMFSQASSVACSIFSLTVLAFERFFVVVFPLWNVITIRGTLWSIASIWLAVLALSWPFLSAGKVHIFDGIPYCIEYWAPAFDPQRAPAIYTIVSFVFLYALPLLVIAVLYSVIAAKVWSRRTPGNVNAASRRVLQENKKNVLKMSTAVVLAFAICWFLIHLNLLFRDFNSDVFEPCGIPSWLLMTGFLLGHANSAINCCIYPIFSQEYRKGFKQSLKCLFSKCSAKCTAGNERAADVPMENRVVN